MDGFDKILSDATAAVPTEYFLLPLHGADPIYRERVYCYELYHQLRQRWPETTLYRVDGEVDKRNHPYFQNEEQPKPDLLAHQPGMGDNFAAIEVKPAGAANRNVLKDLSTLTLLAQGAGYRRLIYLIYGEDCELDVPRVKDQAVQVVTTPIELWLHRAPAAAAALSHVLVEK